MNTSAWKRSVAQMRSKRRRGGRIESATLARCVCGNDACEGAVLSIGYESDETGLRVTRTFGIPLRLVRDLGKLAAALLRREVDGATVACNYEDAAPTERPADE